MASGIPILKKDKFKIDNINLKIKTDFLTGKYKNLKVKQQKLLRHLLLIWLQ